MQHSVRSLPVIFEIDNGSSGVNRVHCAGDYHDVLRGMKLLRRQSLPQNTTTQKERNHAILGTGAGDTDRRLPAVAAGHVGGVGDVPCGEGAGQ